MKNTVTSTPTTKMSFQDIVKRQELAEKKKSRNRAKIALALAIGVNVFNLLFFAGGIYAETVFIFILAFRGVLNILIFIIILALSIKELRNPKNRPIAIIAIILDIISLWPIPYFAPVMWFGAPLFGALLFTF